MFNHTYFANIIWTFYLCFNFHAYIYTFIFDIHALFHIVTYFVYINNIRYLGNT